MKSNQSKKWYVVKVDNNIVIDQFSGFCQRFSSENKIPFKSWFSAWMEMRNKVKSNNDCNVEFCVMELDEMWWIKRFFE